MELNDYQERAMVTCMPTCNNVSYMLLNMVGEVGEFASKIAKGIRKGDFIIKENILYYDPKTQSPKATSTLIQAALE